MSIRNYYKGECSEIVYISVTAYNFEGVDEQINNIRKKYKHAKNKNIEIVISLKL